MNAYLLIALRLIHVFASALWVGAVFVYLFFVKPTVRSIGLVGPKFMQNLTTRTRYPMFMVTVSLLTVLAGAVLYLNTSGGFNTAWLSSGPWIGFTVGSLAGLAAFFVGNFGIGPTAGAMGALGQKIAKAGGPPSPEDLSMLRRLEKKLDQAETIDFVLVSIAMLTMATARYWVF